MRARRHHSSEDLLTAAGSLLTDAPDVLLYGLAAQMRGRPAPDGSYLATVHDGGRVLAGVLRTPGRKLLLTPTTAEVCALVAEEVVAAVPDLGGVLAEVATARAFAGSFCDRTGQRPRDGWPQRLLVLDRLEPPPRVQGHLRRAERPDATLLGEWADAFQAETQVDERAVPGARIVDYRLDRGELFVWDDEGPRSIAAVVGRAPRAARIGMVYTPPEQRGRGYASATVAGLTERLLADGCAACSLFTMATNPISNRIYERLGYAHRADYQDVWFEPAAS